MNLSANQKMRPSLRKWADALTLIRAISGFPLVLALISNNLTTAWLLLILAGLSDFADGWLARLAGGGSTWGAKLDPLADKLLLAAPILWLLSKNLLPIWAVWLLISRELLISGWRSNIPTGAPASKVGKAKTVAQFLSMLFFLWPPNWGNDNLLGVFHGLGWWLFWVSLFLAISSGFSYLSIRANPRRP